jgi:hypothetical protein
MSPCQYIRIPGDVGGGVDVWDLLKNILSLGSVFKEAVLRKLGSEQQTVVSLITSTLIMSADTVSDMLDRYPILTRLIAGENFIAFSRSESFKPNINESCKYL